MDDPSARQLWTGRWPDRPTTPSCGGHTSDCATAAPVRSGSGAPSYREVTTAHVRHLCLRVVPFTAPLLQVLPDPQRWDGRSTAGTGRSRPAGPCVLVDHGLAVLREVDGRLAQPGSRVSGLRMRGVGFTLPRGPGSSHRSVSPRWSRRPSPRPRRAPRPPETCRRTNLPRTVIRILEATLMRTLGAMRH